MKFIVLLAMVYSPVVHAKPCTVLVCPALKPSGKCYRKVMRYSGYINIPKGFMIVGGCEK